MSRRAASPSTAKTSGRDPGVPQGERRHRHAGCVRLRGEHKDNIAYGLDDVDMDEVVKAAKVAQLHDFIEGLPDGYDRGWASGASPLRRPAPAPRHSQDHSLDPPVLILDDSTSSVDMATEYRLQQALDEVIRGRTTFVIAHRLSTVRKADLILALDDGEIVERGTHEELLERDGFYRSIYDLQLRPQEDEPAAVPAAHGGDAR